MIAVAVAAALLAALGDRAAVTVTPVTIYAATVVDTPGDPFTGDPAAALAEDGALLVRDGVIRARGSLAELRAAHPGEAVTRLDGGLLLPGFVDTHVHFPQIRAIGGLGLPLLDWLERYALPEECKLADRAYARAVAGEFTRRPGGVGHDQRAGVRLALRPGHGRAVHRGRAAGPEHHLRPGAVRPETAPRTCCTHRRPRWRTAPT